MITIDWATFIITVPKSYSSLLQASPEVRELDVNQFRLDLKDLEDTVEGMAAPKTHNHTTEYILSGISYARAVEILDPYTVEFEDGQYSISLTGANNNLLDVKVANQVSLLANNSGGLINSEAINDQSYLLAKVWIDKDNGSAGTTYPKGTPTDPSHPWADAYIIATTRNLRGFHIDGTMDFSTESADPMTAYDFQSESPIRGLLALDGRNTTGCTFVKVGLTGALNGRASFDRCKFGLGGTLTGYSGVAFDCTLAGNITLDSSNTENILFKDCNSGIAGGTKPIIDCNGMNSAIDFRAYTGGLEIRNFTAGNNMSIDCLSGSVLLDSTCTAGTIVIRGVVELTDNSGAGCTVITSGTVTELASISVGNIDSDWTTQERKQIRDALGVDGDKSVAKGGQLQEKSEYPNNSTVNTQTINSNDL